MENVSIFRNKKLEGAIKKRRSEVNLADSQCLDA